LRVDVIEAGASCDVLERAPVEVEESLQRFLSSKSRSRLNNPRLLRHRPIQRVLGLDGFDWLNRVSAAG
jgi:hypothetical protein